MASLWVAKRLKMVEDFYWPTPIGYGRVISDFIRDTKLFQGYWMYWAFILSKDPL